MVFVVASDHVKSLRMYESGQSIAPQQTSRVDLAGQFLSVDDALAIEWPSVRAWTVESGRRQSEDLLQVPWAGGFAALQPASPVPTTRSTAPCSPAHIADEGLQFHLLRRRLGGALIEMQLFFATDKPAFDTVVSEGQRRAEHMVSALLSGASPVEIEWVHQFGVGSVMSFLTWLELVSVAEAIQHLRTTTIRSTLAPMFEALQQAAMLNTTRPGEGYALCCNLSRVFGAEPCDLPTAQSALQNGHVLGFANALYKRGATWGLGMLRTWVAQDEAVAGALLIENNREATSKLTGSSAKVIRALRRANQSGIGLERALAEEGLTPLQIERCKEYLIRFKAENVIDKMLSQLTPQIGTSVPQD